MQHSRAVNAHSTAILTAQSGDNRLTHYWDVNDRKIPAKLLYDPNPSSEAPAAVGRRTEEVAVYEAPCAPDAAAYDPACRARKRIQAEVAYNGFGTFRGLPDSDTTCSLKTEWNSWHCDADVGTPARLIIESLVQDETWKVSLVPVAVAGQGFVQVHNGGHVWGRYLERRSTFYSSVYVGYDYDIAFTYTNPVTLRFLLMSPNKADKIRIGIFYSNPHRLQVSYKGVDVNQLSPKKTGSYDFNTLVRPTLTDACGTNMFVAWENKIYITLCADGGDLLTDGLVIRTLPVITLWTDIERDEGVDVTTEEFFDQATVVSNIASLFGIPPGRVRVANAVPDAGTRRRRLDHNGVMEEIHTSMKVAIEIEACSPCADVVEGLPKCGHHGTCKHPDDEDTGGETTCECHVGWRTPAGCDGGECTCSEQDCAAGCSECTSSDTGLWLGTAPSNCTKCDVDTTPFWDAAVAGETCSLDVPGSCQCVPECLGSYPAADTRICTACHDTCAQCRAPTALKPLDGSLSCKECHGNLPWLIHTGECVANEACTEKMYKDGGACKACHTYAYGLHMCSCTHACEPAHTHAPNTCTHVLVEIRRNATALARRARARTRTSAKVARSLQTQWLLKCRKASVQSW